MKHALLFGGASKNGKQIIKALLDNNFKVINVGSSSYDHDNVKNIIVDWKNINIEFIQQVCGKIAHNLDFVFFNQNSSSLSIEDFSIEHDDILEKWKLIKDWSNSHWLSCQMPFLVIHTIRNNLHKDSQIGWMLSDFINYQAAGAMQHPDYSGFKFFNYLSMSAFNNQNDFFTFGIMPNFESVGSQKKLEEIIFKIINKKSKKQVYKI